MGSSIEVTNFSALLFCTIENAINLIVRNKVTCGKYFVVVAIRPTLNVFCRTSVFARFVNRH